jgi:hypothetical protein
MNRPQDFCSIFAGHPHAGASASKMHYVKPDINQTMKLITPNAPSIPASYCLLLKKKMASVVSIAIITIIF